MTQGINRARLSVNVDHVATVRQARLGAEPDPVLIAMMAEQAGADSITVHLREDRRHIQDRDVIMLRKTIKTKLNLEMAATKEMLNIALEIKPDLVTLVPEKREELTTEGGLDVKSYGEQLKKYISSLNDGDIPVNLFVDPELDVVKISSRLGASGVELHTGTYAELTDFKEKARELKRVSDAVVMSKRLNLAVHAGHGLDYHNIRDFKDMVGIEEYAIGFSIISKSIHIGIDKAVRDMISLIR